jgi:hypothetical protein
MANDTHTDPDPDGEITVEAAAEMLGESVAFLREILAAGAIPSRVDGDTRQIAVADVVGYREERARRRVHLRAITRIVDASPGGWDS